ncbi:MAG TPA: hypothetical protein VJL89_03210 [Thermodesulfovibrionia bacterium]|nr:hypothetical protein [Thermodesulfovibrionia bacterium]
MRVVIDSNKEQRKGFDELLLTLGHNSSAQAKEILDEREPVEPEKESDPESVKEFLNRLAKI